jgi:hypothetical protein
LKGPHSLLELLARARRRSIAHLALDQTALAAVVGMGGMILLLLVGTQVLDWYWVALLAAASLGTGLYRLRKTIPTEYKVAQRIDRRLSLSDTLSTAAYFATQNGHTGNRSFEAVRDKQRQEAETLARTVDLNRGVPFRRSRYAYPALGLALAAFGLFALRYAVIGSLSLQPSLVRIAYDTFFGTNAVEAKARPLKPDLKPGDTDPNSPDANRDEVAPDSAPDTLENPELNDPHNEGDQSKADQDQNADLADNGDKSDPNDANQNSDKKSDSKDDRQEGKQDAKQGSDNANSSLMDKLRDAMQNLLNKMKPGDRQQAQNQQKGQQNKQNSEKQKSQQQKKGDNSSSDDQQSGESGDQKQSADAEGNQKSSDKTTPEDARSGIGSEDVEKAVREAEAMAAMGKISELLGKRAQNVSGEVLVEVGQSKQQLKTPYAQKQAAHAEAGSEINRDEVPLIYQQFVEQYFEAIRKTPPPAK